MAFSIAHLSDPHISTGMLAGAPATGLNHALGRILALDRQPDCVVITGDLVDRGHSDEYTALREVLDRFPLPLHLVPGNHDNSSAMLDEFGGTDFLGGTRHSQYAVDHPAATIVVLDSQVSGSAGGHLGAAQLTWLDKTLARRPDIPAFVCLHHPPIPIGIPFLDGMRLSNGDALAEVIGRHPNVARVLAGHAHRAVTAAFASTTLAIAPSTYLQSGLSLREGVPNYLPEPTSFLLHLLADTSWITHIVPVSHAAAPIACF